MSRFKFRLQRVLDLRERREQEMTLALANAQRAAAQAREVHDTLESACSDGQAHIARAAAGVDARAVGELQYLSLVLERLHVQANTAGEARSAADAEVDLSTSALAAAARARQVLEQLREHQQVAWRQEETHADQMAMDAIALSQYVLRIARATGAGPGGEGAVAEGGE